MMSVGSFVSEYEADPSTALQVSNFGRKLDQLWNKTNPNEFIKSLKDYHWHLWRGGMTEVDLDSLLGLIIFEKSAGFPLNHEDVVKAYRKAQYGFVRERIEGDKRLSREFKKELQFKMPGDPEPSGKAAITIEPDWENYWEGFPGLSFHELKQKSLLPLYWYVHGAEEEFGAAYKGAVLVKNDKVLFYDRYPMGGGPFKVSDFEDRSFRRRSEIVAENVERALEGLKSKVNPSEKSTE